MHAQAKRKYQEVCQEKQNLEADRAELQSKYQQKSQQYRNLQARADIMQHTCEWTWQCRSVVE